MSKTLHIRNNRPRRREGFTLVELMMVVLIIGVLAGLVLTIAGIAGRRSDRAKAINDMERIKDALEEYRIVQNEYYPDADFPNPLSNYKPFIEAMYKNGLIPPNTNNPPTILVDPWGRNYRYIRDPKMRFSFTLFSQGPDGKDGTEDDVNLNQGAM